MALIQNSNPKERSGGFARLFGDEALGDLMSKVQSAIISSGSELENIIKERVARKRRLIEDLPAFLRCPPQEEEVFLAPKKVVRYAKNLGLKEIEPDFLLFDNHAGQQNCLILELKDGHLLDTKKSAKERENLLKAEQILAPQIPYTVSFAICCFNQESLAEISRGLKGAFKTANILTGKALCDLLGLSYTEILELRRQDSAQNRQYFLEQLLAIPSMASLIKSGKLYNTDDPLFKISKEDL